MGRMGWAVVVLGWGVLASGCTVLAQYKTGVFKEEPIRVGPLVLPNGLQVIVEEDTGSPMVGVALTVAVGAHADPAGREGLAHFVEHLAYRVPFREGQAVRDALELAGVADYNGETDADTTSFYAQGPRSSLATMLAAAARQLSDPGTVDAATFEVERQVVLAELNQGSDASHGQTLNGWLLEALYPPESSSARPLAGTAASLRALTPADVAAFQRAHYCPPRATLAITGGASQGAVLAALNQLFAPGTTRVPHEAVEHPTVLPPEPPPVRLRTHQAPLAEDQLWVAWSVPSRFALRSAGDWLAGRLDWWIDSFRHEEEAIRDSSCAWRPGLHEAQVLCVLTLRAGADPQAVFDFVLARLDNKKDVMPTSETEHSRVVEEVHTVLMTAMERAAMRARRGAVQGELVLNLAPTEKVSLAALNKELAWVSRARARAIVIKRGGARLPPSVAEGAVRALAGSRGLGTELTAEAVQRLAWPLGTQRAELEQLRNGMQVGVLPVPRSPLVAVALLLPGGRALAEPPGAAELGLILGRTNVVGLWKDTGAIQSQVLTRDGLQYLMLSQPRNLESVLRWLSYSMQGTWQVDTLLLSEVRYRTGAELKELERRPLARASTAFQRALWQGHRYGLETTAEQYQTSSDLEIESWVNRLYGPGQAVLTVVGDVNPDHTLALLRSLFEPLPPRKAIPVPVVPEARPGRSLLATDIPGMGQVGLTWGCRVSTPGSRQQVVAQLMASWLEGQLTWRLREQAGLTYTSSAWSTSLWGGAGELTASLEVRGSELGKVLTVLDELLQGRDLSAPQLLGAAWDAVRTRNARYELPSPLALDLARDARNGWPVTSRDDAPALMTSVTPEELRTALAACRQVDVTMLVGHQPVIEAGVREAGGRPVDFLQ